MLLTLPWVVTIAHGLRKHQMFHVLQNRKNTVILINKRPVNAVIQMSQIIL